MKQGPWNINLRKRQSTQQPPKIEKKVKKVPKTAKKSPKIPNGSGWHNDWERHGMAAKGIKTGKKSPTSGLGNVTATKHKLADGIQNDMHKSDKLLRKASKVKDVEMMKQLVKEADTVYDRLGNKIQSHKQKYGELPYWVAYTWHGHENFTKNGRVKNIMREAKDVEQKGLEAYQRKLFNAIKLGNEASK